MRAFGVVHKFLCVIVIVSLIFSLSYPVYAVQFTRLQMEGIASNSISNIGKTIVVPASMDIYILSGGGAIHQQRAPFSGILIINNEDIEVEGTIYTHDFQLTSMTRVSKRDMFYRLNFARSGYLIGLYKNSTIACHGRYGGYILSFEGIINEELEDPISEYPTAHLAPFWQ